MPSALRFLACCVFLLGGAALAARAAVDVKFSATLTPEQRGRTGLAQLTADHVAVIDGLVRQDQAASRYKDNDVDHTRFSQRHTPRERELAGLDRLNAAQLGALDELVARHIAGDAPAIVASLGPVPVGSAGVKPDLPTRKLDIHGEFGVTYGWGPGGAVTGTEVVLNYTDPAGRYAITAGFSEWRGHGLAGGIFAGYGPYGTCPPPAFR